MWLEDGRRAGAAISLTGNTDINKVDINNMDIDLDDIFSVPVSKPAPTVSKFRPNANRPVLRKGSCAPANAKRGNLKSVDPAATVNNVQNVAVSDPVDVHPHEEGVSQSLNDIHKQESILESQGPPLLSNMSLDIPIQDPLESSSFGVTDDTQSENFPDFTVVQESETFEEDAILIGGDSQINEETIVREEAEVFPGLATIESFPDSMATSSIGQHRGKLIPKKIKGGSKKPDSGSQHSEAKEDHLPDVLVNSEAAFSNEGPTPSSVSEGVFDYSSLMLDECTPDVQFSQPPQSESFEDCLEPSRFDAFISKEAAAGVDTDVLGNSNYKNANRDAAVQDSFQNCKNAAAHNDVAQYSDGITGEANVNATGEETLSPMKKGPRKSKTTRTKSEKTTKKRKNGDDTVPEQPSEEQETPKKKKFSHSTQRRKRCVDKVLLQTPEEDIDYQKLRMKDLIFLAEHKEKLAKKAKMTKTSSGSASTQKSVDGDDSYNKESIVTPEENESPDQETNNVEQIITLFNYQSFMNKAPTAKWSKQDTELFYEGIKQFGTDLGMIKELFPDLTRHQVKLKYKKEERQNPLRLSEALYGRAKDHRHFEMVIQRLQAANKAETESNADDSAAVTGDGDCEGGEEVSNGEANNQEEATSVPEKESKDEVDHGNFETPQESQNQHEDEEEEIDEDFFSSYKSEY